MPVARVRCSACKAYVPREEVYYESRMTKVCSEACFTGIYERQKIRERARKKATPKPRKESRLDAGLRQRVRSRDGGVCRWCGVRGEQIHHILYRSQGGPDHPGNLILLCAKHHMQAHSNKRHWQPTLLALIWLGYAEHRWLTVPEVEKLLLRLGLL
jgi:5-methylcytosine-specific restriction endonuclease McrA